MSEKSIRVHKILTQTKVEGPGNRMVFWVQGCSIHCKGCFEKDTWDPHAGYSISLEQMQEYLKNEEIEGVTILGGEPFDQVDSISQFLEMVRNQNKNSIVFTGYTIEYLKNLNSSSIDQALGLIDLLVDGAFDENLLEKNRVMVGSTNQRFIALNNTGTDLECRLNKQKNKVEIRINSNGIIKINGMWMKGEMSNYEKR